MRIDHIGVVVDNLAEAKQFMEHALGLTLEREAVVSYLFLKSAFYKCGDASIELIEVSDPELRSQRLGEAQARIEHIAVEVDDMEATLQMLKAAGVKLEEPEPRVVETPLGRSAHIVTQPESSDGVKYQFVKKG